ncbi:DUF6122 family protein [Algiphilus sp. W345]|uniref:DUF6122 family protein n=1 Tax=Banduia mediterranea TaxID=3075609 RepID=A0ABU2WEV4_9GAMM|nr:DUF6122 family protein [Algiphilus sp. W345]MDT0496399.1 DUF6122 family protein [Algiphilus sp. W345]
MSLASLLHMVLHVAVPAVVALLFFRRQWRRAFLVMMATMAVDLDHLLADPKRCSIGFHPLHTWPAILLWLGLAAWPATRLVGLGLSLHMLLDFSDCTVQRGLADALSRVLALP